MFNTPESATAAVERYEAQPEEGSAEYHRAIDGCAEYFLEQIFAKNQTLRGTPSEMFNRFVGLAVDDMGSARLGNLLFVAIKDACEAGAGLKRYAMTTAKTIAEEYREYLEPLAREAGYIKE